MDPLTRQLLPLVLVLGRTSGLVTTMPVWSGRGLPMRVRAGLALVLGVFLAGVVPVPARLRAGGLLEGGLLLVQEMLIGVALGLSVTLVFAAIRQTGEIIRMQMGMREAEILDPLSGDEADSMGLLIEMGVLVLFLAAGGHRLLLAVAARSYDVFPLGQAPSAQVLLRTVLESGSLMLAWGLRLAGPLMASFLLLSVVLAVLARALPEMNVLLASLPLRVGLGLFMAAAMVPSLGMFTEELGEWLAGFLVA